MVLDKFTLAMFDEEITTNSLSLLDIEGYINSVDYNALKYKGELQEEGEILDLRIKFANILYRGAVKIESTLLNIHVLISRTYPCSSHSRLDYANENNVYFNNKLEDKLTLLSVHMNIYQLPLGCESKDIREFLDSHVEEESPLHKHISKALVRLEGK